ACGQYISLDAAQTLSKFIVDGLPDERRFHELIGRVLTRAADGGHHVRAFGEMVALLWKEGNYNGAIRLEELWNNLQKTNSFSLFCAYPMSGMESEESAESLSKVCLSHSHVIPAESYVELADPNDRLQAIILLQQKAR